MGDEERFQKAEQFVRDSIKHFGSKATEYEIRQAALKAAKCLPPFTTIQDQEKVKAQRYELVALDAGDMYVYYPDPMSEADAADAESHLMSLLRRIKRRAVSAKEKEETDAS